MAEAKNKKKDVRFWRTEKALLDAMKDLLAYKDFDDITINDICERAAVSRTTFYLHYKDKYALVHAWFDADVVPPPELFCDETMAEYFNRLFDAEYAYCDQMFHLVHPHGSKELQWRISAMWSGGFLRYYKKKQQTGARFEAPYEMMALYNCSGVVNLIWLNILNGYPFSKETMVAYIVRKIQQSNDLISY